MSHYRVTCARLFITLGIFPFLFLPAELRNAIYELCFSFSGIERFFDRYYRSFEKSKEPPYQHPVPCMTTPNIFLLNRQISSEATSLLNRCAIRFRHGLLGVPLLKNIVCENILKQVSSIEISDVGHPIMKSKTMAASWFGYTRLLKGLGWALADGHSLKKLVISFNDPRLVVHMTECFHHPYSCGFRDDLQTTLMALRLIRGVSEVTITGINGVLAAELKAIMQTFPRVTFASLPLEARRMIWFWALDWSDISKQYALAVTKPRLKGTPAVCPPLSTPTALLLNHQYTAEALAVLRKKPLTLTFPAVDQKWSTVPHISCFISRLSLSHVVHLEVRLEDWQWAQCFTQEFIASFAEHSTLRTLTVYFYDPLKESIERFHAYPDIVLDRHLQSLTALQGLETVEFVGNLPKQYTDSLAALMTQVSTRSTVPSLT